MKHKICKQNVRKVSKCQFKKVKVTEKKCICKIFCINKEVFFYLVYPLFCNIITFRSRIIFKKNQKILFFLPAVSIYYKVQNVNKVGLYQVSESFLNLFKQIHYKYNNNKK